MTEVIKLLEGMRFATGDCNICLLNVERQREALELLRNKTCEDAAGDRPSIICPKCGKDMYWDGRAKVYICPWKSCQHVVRPDKPCETCGASLSCLHDGKGNYSVWARDCMDNNYKHYVPKKPCEPVIIIDKETAQDIVLAMGVLCASNIITAANPERCLEIGRYLEQALKEQKNE